MRKAREGGEHESVCVCVGVFPQPLCRGFGATPRIALNSERFFVHFNRVFRRFLCV